MHPCIIIGLNPLQMHTFQKIYNDLIEQLNPDDITAKLYSANIISHTERENVDCEMVPANKNNLILRYVEKATIKFILHF